MSRNLSSGAIAALNAQETDEAFLVLLTIDHDDFSVPIRVCSDAVDVTSRSNSYVSFPFDLVLPDDTDNQSPRARLTIDNVDRQVVQAIRQIDTAPSVLIEIIRAADPDTVEASFPDFIMTDISYDALTVSGELTLEDFTAEPFPAGVFSPAEFPALF